MVLFNLLTRIVIEDWQKTLDDGQRRDVAAISPTGNFDQ
jgi:hypothetical protein